MQVAMIPRTARGTAKSSSSIGLVAITAAGLALCLALAIAVDPSIALFAVFAIVIPIGLFYVVSRPAVAVGVALASHAWAFELAGPYLTPFKIAGVAALLIVIRNIFEVKRIHPIPRAYFAGFLALLFVVAVGELFAEFDGTIQPFYEFGGTLVIFLLLTQTILKSSDFRIIARIYTINLLFTAAAVWRQVDWAALSDGGTRAIGICGQPNVLGNHLAMSLPFALALFADREQPLRWRILALFGALGSAYGEWAAASRGGTVGFAFALFTFALLAPRRPAIRLASLASAVLVAAAFTTYAPKSFDRVTETFDGTADLETASSERAAHARISAEMVPRHPFLGAGLTAFGYERSRTSGAMGSALHSSVLAVAVSYGLPALLLYVILQISSVVVVLRALPTNSDRVYLAGLAAAAVAAITSGLSGTELFRAEQWGVISLCHIAVLRGRVNQSAANREQSGA